MLIILLLCIALTSIILSLFSGTHRERLEAISVGSAGLEFLVGMIIVSQVVSLHRYVAGNLFSVDALGAIILGTTVTVGFIATLHSVGYLRSEQKKGMLGRIRIREYYTLMELFLLCMLVAITTTNPLVLWIAIEATTLSTVFLISLFNRTTDIEAAWKYLIINSVGLLLGLLGTLLFLLQGPAGGFITWHDLLVTSAGATPAITKFAFIFILIGYGTKMGLVPLHTWKPDAYNKAPLPIVALLSGALLNVAFLAILRYKVLTDITVGRMFSQQLFMFFGTLSVIVSALSIYAQTNYKRLLAYSSIEHAGLMMLGFAFGGIGVFGALLHMVYHSLAKSLLFLTSSTVAVTYSSSDIKDVTGMTTVLPSTSLLYLIGFLTVIGLPPFGMFFSEWYIFLAGFHQHPLITILAISAVLLVFAGFLRHVSGMLFGIPPQGIHPEKSTRWAVIPITALAILLLVLSMVIPPQLHTLLNNSAGMFTTSYDSLR